MNEIEALILLVAVGAVLVRLSDALSIPYPIVLVIGGLSLGFLPGGPDIELDPEVIFLVFLPPLLQAAGYYSSPRELRAELGPLSGLVLGLTLATMLVVGAVAQAAIPEISWAEGLLLGAIVAPTDPVAALATFDRVGVTERVRLLVESESMVNDATALVAYRVALTAVVAGTLSAGDAVLELVVAVAGGIAIGFAVGWAGLQASKRVDDDSLVTLVSLLMAYVAFALAEQVEASGVLAVVTTGLYLGWNAHKAFGAEARLHAQAFWQVLVFILNIVLFILLGLQAPDILESVGERFDAAEIVGYGLLVSATVIAMRLAWQFLPPLLERVLPAAGRISTGDGWRESVLIGWSGMRGAVSLAAALALPLTLDDGSAFADRDLIIYLTVAVILVTLVGQGLTLPALIRWLGLSRTVAWAPDEAVARLEAAQAALDHLDRLEQERDDVPDEVIERLREVYRARFQRCVEAMEGEAGGRTIEDPASHLREVRRELIGVERSVLLKLRDEDRAKADVLRRIQRELDLDEARFAG